MSVSKLVVVAAAGVMGALVLPVVLATPAAYLGPEQELDRSCGPSADGSDRALVALAAEPEATQQWSDAARERGHADLVDTSPPEVRVARCGDGVQVWGMPRREADRQAWYDTTAGWVDLLATEDSEADIIGRPPGVGLQDQSDMVEEASSPQDADGGEEQQAEQVRAALARLASVIDAIPDAAGGSLDLDDPQLQEDRALIVEALLAAGSGAHPPTGPDDLSAPGDDASVGEGPDDSSPAAPDQAGTATSDDVDVLPPAAADLSTWVLSPPASTSLPRVLGGVIAVAVATVLISAISLLRQLPRLSFGRRGEATTTNSASSAQDASS